MKKALVAILLIVIGLNFFKKEMVFYTFLLKKNIKMKGMVLEVYCSMKKNIGHNINEWA
jgi:hypothetical protein